MLPHYTDNATADQIARAKAAVLVNMVNDMPMFGSAQGYACALTAIMQTDAQRIEARSVRRMRPKTPLQCRELDYDRQ
jgi:hypothetical protein